MNNFKVGEIVIYKCGNEYSLGEIKEVLPPPIGTVYKYRVLYHTGETSAVTNCCDLKKINNLYAFNIKRKECI